METIPIGVPSISISMFYTVAIAVAITGVVSVTVASLGLSLFQIEYIGINT